MALPNTPDSDIRARAFRHRTRRPSTRTRPIRRPSPEALEDRCLLATTYSITDIDALPTANLPHYWVAINNATPAQVIAGEGPDGQAFVFDSVDGLRDLGTIKGQANSTSNGINDNGQVTGRSWTETTTLKKTKYGVVEETKIVENGFLWTPSGGTSNLGNGVQPDAINNSGEIIGLNSIWNGKTWTVLGNLPGGTISSAYGLNNRGQVVGYSMNNNGTFEQGYLWSPFSPNGASGTMISLGSFDTTSFGGSIAAAINDGGLITGSASNADRYGGAGHAFVWKPSAPNVTTGTMVDLGTLANNSDSATSQSEGLAINSSGVVVGDSTSAGNTGQIDAVIWQPGPGGTYTLTDLNSLLPSGTGWTLTRAYAINDAGLIVAEGIQGGTTRFVLLTPQTTSTALAAPAALAMRATAPGPIRSPAAPSAASVEIVAVAPNGPGPGGQPGPASTADRVAAPPAALSIFDFALADLVARPRPKTAVNGGTARPMWADPGTSC